MTKEGNKEVSSNSVTPTPDKTVRGAAPWKKLAKGVPVEAGKDWVTGLTHEQRCMAMNSHEQFWKQKYNSQRGTVALQQNWTRG